MQLKTQKRGEEGCKNAQLSSHQSCLTPSRNAGKDTRQRLLRALAPPQSTDIKIGWLKCPGGRSASRALHVWG